MKIIAIKLIEFYQAVINVILKNLLGTSHFCRKTPTCSQYVKNQILEKGVIKGGFLGLLRILSCQPFSKIAVDNR